MSTLITFHGIVSQCQVVEFRTILELLLNGYYVYIFCPSLWLCPCLSLCVCQFMSNLMCTFIRFGGKVTIDRKNQFRSRFQSEGSFYSRKIRMNTFWILSWAGTLERYLLRCRRHFHRLVLVCWYGRYQNRVKNRFKKKKPQKMELNITK